MKKRTPLRGAILLDCEANYIEVHCERPLSGQVISAQLQFSVLAIKIRTIQKNSDTIFFTASSLSEKDWRRLCRSVLNDYNTNPQNDPSI